MVIGLGDLYEDTSIQYKEGASDMDRHNNRVGAYIGASHPNASEAEIEKLIWEAMEDGQLQISRAKVINYHTLKEYGTQD